MQKVNYRQSEKFRRYFGCLLTTVDLFWSCFSSRHPKMVLLTESRSETTFGWREEEQLRKNSSIVQAIYLIFGFECMCNFFEYLQCVEVYFYIKEECVLMQSNNQFKYLSGAVPGVK